ncbi:MAG TPA: serpin family protein [Polyangiaceae bacterium]|nr:serpin family protein [Polyangiaceae bacterium]
MERRRVNVGLGSILGLVGMGLVFGACSGGKSAADAAELSGGGAAETMALGGGGAAHTPALGGGGAAVGGGGAATGSDAVSDVRSSKARVMPAASEAARATSSEQAFALSFLHALPGNENLTFSPHSLSTAFAMLSCAADGETLQELQDALQFGATDEAFHRAQSALNLALAARNHEATDDVYGKADARILTESNDLWIRQDAKPADSFLDTLALYYGAGVHLADFKGHPEGVRKAINDKIATVTHQLISDIIPTGVLNENTVAVLTNALYFKAPWAKKFAPRQPGDFHRLDGSTSAADMLNTRATLHYYEGNGFVSVAVPYWGGELSMQLVVPDAGAYEQVREQLSSEGLRDMLAGQAFEDVDLTLPVFELEYEAPAMKAFEQLGLARAFDPEKAEFPKLESEMFKTVHIDAVAHKATVAIDEDGTEASAVTAITGSGGGSSGPPPEPKVVKADRPFLFLIRDNPTGSLLFVGQVVER